MVKDRERRQDVYARGYRDGWRDCLEETRRATDIAARRTEVEVEVPDEVHRLADRLLAESERLREELRRQEEEDRRSPVVDPPIDPPPPPPAGTWPEVELELDGGLWDPTPELWAENPTGQSVPETWDILVAPGRVKRSGQPFGWEVGLEGQEIRRALAIAGELARMTPHAMESSDIGFELLRLTTRPLVRIELTAPGEAIHVFQGVELGKDVRWTDLQGLEVRIRDVIFTTDLALLVDDEGEGREKLLGGISISGMRAAPINNQGAGGSARDWPGVDNLIFAGVNLETPKGSSDAFHVSGTHGLTHGALRFWSCSNVPSRASLTPDSAGKVAYNGTGQKWGFKGSGAAVWEFLDCYWDRAEEHDVYAERPQGKDLEPSPADPRPRHYGFWAWRNRQARGGNGRTSIQLTSRGAAEKHDAVPPGWKVVGATGDCYVHENVFRDNVSRIASGGSDITVVGWPNGDVFIGQNLHAGIAATTAGPGQARGLITCWVDEFYGVILNPRGFAFREIHVDGELVATTGEHKRGLFKFSGAELVNLENGFDISAESSWPQVTLNAYDAGSSYAAHVERALLPPPDYVGWNETGPKVVVGVIDPAAPKGRRMVTLSDAQIAEFAGGPKRVREVVS